MLLQPFNRAPIIVAVAPWLTAPSFPAEPHNQPTKSFLSLAFHKLIRGRGPKQCITLTWMCSLSVKAMLHMATAQGVQAPPSPLADFDAIHS